jgi:hypothetical protein
MSCDAAMIVSASAGWYPRRAAPAGRAATSELETAMLSSPSLVYDRVHNAGDGTPAVLGTQTFTI